MAKTTLSNPREAHEASDSDIAQLSDSDLEPVTHDGVTELEDGSAIVHDEKPKKAKSKGNFDDNLAETLDETLLTTLGRELCDLIEMDKDARKERDKQYAEGIKRTGLSMKRDVGADFDGASSVTHPMLAKGCVDFASKAVKEIFPSSGPVRTQIIGDQTDVKLERAERKKTYMNWQLTDQIPEHRPELEKLLSQLPLGGSQYKRWWWDSRRGRAATEAVYIDNVFLPYDQNDFYTSPRVTHREFLGQTAFDARVRSGLYREVAGSNLGSSPERSMADEAARAVEGVEDDSSAYTNEGGTREVFTVYVDWDLEEEDQPDPYIVHVEEYGAKVLGVYRNWAEKDKRKLKLDWIVEYPFIPWRGAYSVGLGHLIGSMAVAGTGALNALLDAAHINNFPGAIRLAGGRNAGQSKSVNPTEITEITAPPGADDIRKIVMPFPFNGPSQVLYTLLEFLTQQAEVVVATASEKIADAGSNMPVGTAMALIEGGSTNFSAIHARLHNAAKRELAILHRLNATYLDDEDVVEELGELVVYRDDFQGPVDIIPVSDPNIFSEAQRYAQVQAILQLQAMPQFQGLFKNDKLLQRIFRVMQVPYADDIATLPRDPQRLPPVEENSAAAQAAEQATPLKVFPEQDDFAHLQSHVLFMTSPILGGSPIVGSLALPRLIAHCRDHLVALYKKHHEAAGKAMAVIARHQGQTTNMEQLEAQSHAFADKQMAQMLAPVVAPGLQQAAQLMQQFAPKPPPSGDIAAQVQAQSTLEQAKLQSAEKQLGMKLQADTQEKDKQRTFEAGQNQLTIQAEDKREQARLAETARATDAAERTEKMQQQSDERIANIEAATKTFGVQHSQQMDLLKQEMQATNQAALVVLQGLIKELAPQMVAAQPDIGKALMPLIGAVQKQGQDVLDALNVHAETMGELMKAVKAKRVAKHIKDANGEVIGAESSIEGEPSQSITYQ